MLLLEEKWAVISTGPVGNFGNGIRISHPSDEHEKNRR
jgi:hypothetical protein